MEESPGKEPEDAAVDAALRELFLDPGPEAGAKEAKEKADAAAESEAALASWRYRLPGLLLREG